MDTTKPNYSSYGFSTTMGLQLRRLVEEHLISDLGFYDIRKSNLKFDWSESCIEGHDTSYLDGSLENYSGISVFDEADNLVAEGWMEFIHEGDFFLCYWEFITTWENGKKLKEKNEVGIPNHIWKQIHSDIRPFYENQKTKTNRQ